MTPQTSIEHVGAQYEVRCSRCPDWHPRRELQLDAESVAQRHMDEHARQRRVA
jgi:hypothetical protein